MMKATLFQVSYSIYIQALIPDLHGIQLGLSKLIVTGKFLNYIQRHNQVVST